MKNKTPPSKIYLPKLDNPIKPSISIYILGRKPMAYQIWSEYLNIYWPIPYEANYANRLKAFTRTIGISTPR